MMQPIISHNSLLSGPNLTAVSRYVAEQRESAWNRLRASRSLGKGWEEAARGLRGVVEQCSFPDWDGYGAEPVSKETARLAWNFLAALPLGMPAPAVSAEPDGHLTFEWYRSRRRTLSVSVSPDGELHYAALLGPNKAFGTEVFLGEIPKTILDWIERVHPA